MKFVNPRNAPAGTSALRVPYWDENRSAGTTGAIPPAKVLNDVQDEILAVIATGGGLTPDPSDMTQLLQAIQAMVAAAVSGSLPSVEVPPGMLGFYAAATPPAGWLKCNGQTVSRTTYDELFAAIGTTYGGGNGSTTFTLPDFRGEFVRGLDDGRGIDAARGIGTWQDWATGAPKNTSVQHINGDGSKGPLIGANVTPGGASNPSAVGFVRASKTGEAVTTSNEPDSAYSGQEMDLINVVTGDAETRPRNRASLIIIKT